MEMKERARDRGEGRRRKRRRDRENGREKEQWEKNGFDCTPHMVFTALVVYTCM